MKQKTVRKLHRWLGLIFSVTILMSAGSGILHNIMTRVQSAPPPARPAQEGLLLEDIRYAPADIAKHLSDEDKKHIQAVSIRIIQQTPWYQIFIRDKTEPVYVNAVTGELDAGRDEIYAEQIASDYLGGKSVQKTDYLTHFNSEYLNIFRILPVYRFDANDGLGTRVYVSTMTGSVTRHTDHQRQFEASTFTNLHKFGFIPDKDLRDVMLTLVTSGIFIAALFGVILFLKTKPNRKGKSI